MLWSAGALLCIIPLEQPLLNDSVWQEMALNHKGTVAQCDHREYGFAQIRISKINGNVSTDALFEGLGDDMHVRSPYLFPLTLFRTYPYYSGLDVSWRPALGYTASLSLDSCHKNCAVCSHRTRFKTILWDPVPPGGHTYSYGKTGYRTFRGQYLWMSNELDYGTG
jgi:hypothetical protein